MEINREMLQALKREYGDAFYLLDSVQFTNNFEELKGAFSEIYPHFNIAYSYKTNYTPKLCKIVNRLGGYAEVVSEMEAELALRIGVKPSKIIWNGPVKNPIYLEKFLLDGGTVNIDSFEEFEYIRKIVEQNREQILKLGIRCNFDVEDGVVSRFGLDVTGDEFKKILEFTQKTPNVQLINLQCHFAKRQVEYWPARARGMVELIDRIDIIPERIDLGGGIFGKMEESLKAQFASEIPEYKEYAKAAASVLAERFKDEKQKPELLIEPGSALVGDCMKFIGTVKTIKNVRGKTYVTILGSQKNISMTGVNPPVRVVSMGNKQKEYKNADFVGFTCIENDVLYRNYSGKIATEDMVVINNCGSYSLVMKPPFILPNFPVLDCSEGRVELIKHAETFDDIFHTFVM